MVNIKDAAAPDSRGLLQARVALPLQAAAAAAAAASHSRRPIPIRSILPASPPLRLSSH